MTLPAAFADLQIRLGYAFRDVNLLQRAMTHRSFGADHNERLEFLGDSVLNLVVAHLLFDRLANMPEGDLSRVRANLVKQETLHQLALQLELPGRMRLGEGELKSGGTRRASILADALEALIGGVYLDGGFDAAQALVQRLFAKVEIRPDMQAAEKDPKTQLQEWLQGRKLPLPRYTVIGTSGAAHRQTFEVACEVPDLKKHERGTGASRRAAEQAAAAALLAILTQADKA
ncbi:ribonuclease III [Limnohabitans sp.]|uniref:ribonuclease III n=1 Tax=Limnohabitans sp. TaxID=1907725 RepID=UPI00311E3AE3